MFKLVVVQYRIEIVVEDLKFPYSSSAPPVTSVIVATDNKTICVVFLYRKSFECSSSRLLSNAGKTP